MEIKNQFLSKIWQAVKCSLKWILIQYAVIFFFILLLYVWSLISNQHFWDLLNWPHNGLNRLYNWIYGFLSVIPFYTVILSLWHSFLNKKEYRWTIIIPWVVIYISFYLYHSAHSQHVLSICELVCWSSPLYGALLQGIIIFFRKKKAAKIQEQEYQEMLSSVQGMFDRVILTKEEVEKHLHKVTDEELANLISIIKSVPPEEIPSRYKYCPCEKDPVAYCCPPSRSVLITYSLEKNPDNVFHLDKFEHLKLNFEFIEPPSDSNWKILEIRDMNKDYYLFLYDSFGLSDSYLCARKGFALYDIDKKDILAYHWTWIS